MENNLTRFERKYLIDKEQYYLLLGFTEGKIVENIETDYKISNLYYDTENYDLIKSSINIPVYKEKLRLRTYESPGISIPAYIELKKKVDGLIYKKRFKTTLAEGLAFLGGGLCPVTSGKDASVVREISRYLDKNDLSAKALITYNREAWHGVSDPSLRVTFDTNIVYKDMNLGQNKTYTEMPLIEYDKMIMEIKTTGGIPIWLSKTLSELEIFPTTFSKYETAYKTYISDEPIDVDEEDLVGIGA